MSGERADAPALRAFLALPVDDQMRARVAETMAVLKGSVEGVRWVQDAGVHLTLRFLGSARPAALERLNEPLQRAAQACPALEAGFGGLGMFPERGNPRVLWLGARLQPEQQALQAACEAAAVAAGFEPEARPFRAHLTLGRWKDRARRPSLPSVELGSCVLDRLVLFRSDLKPSGAVHTALASFALGD